MDGLGRGQDTGDLLRLAQVQVVFQFLEHAPIRRLGSVGDVAEDGVVQVLVHGLEHTGRDEAAQGHALAVDVRVAAAREVNALE